MSIVKKLIEQFQFSTSNQLRHDALTKLAQFYDNEDALDFLITIVTDEDDEIRLQAIDSLGAFKDKKATYAILKTLEDPNWDIRRKATILLGQKNNTIAVDHLINLLNEEDWDIRKNAIEALGKIGDKAAFHHMVAALNDEHEFVRKSAVEALGHLGDKEAASYIKESIKDPSPYVRAAAAKTLGLLKDTTGIDALITALGDEADSVRKMAAEALGDISLVCIKNINSSVPEIRYEAIECLGKIGNNQSVEALLKNLNDTDLLVRRSVIDSLGKSTNPRVIEPLANIVTKNQDVLSRVKAVKAISQINDKRIIPPVISALKDSNELVRYAAVEAIDSIGDLSLGEHLVPLCIDRDENVKFLAIKTVGKFGTPNAVDKLNIIKNDKTPNLQKAALEALHSIESKHLASLNSSKNTDEKKEAIKALAKIGNLSSLESLLLSLAINDKEIHDVVINAIEKIQYDITKVSLDKALESDNEEVLVNTINVLMKKPSQDNIPKLISLLKDPNSKVYYKAREAILSYRDQAINPLVFCLSDENEHRRAEAVKLLSNFNDMTSFNAILAALDDKSLDVRRAAVISLGRTGNQVAVVHLQKMLNKLEDLKLEIFNALKQIYDRQRSVLNTSPDLKERIHAMETLGESNDMNIALNDILPFINYKDKALQRNAVKILGKYKDPKIIKPLLNLFENQDEELSSMIKNILIDSGEMSISPMLECLKSCTKDTAKEIGTILHETGATNSLLQMLGKEENRVKEKIIYALSGTDNDIAFTYLLETLKNPEIDLCISAVTTLGELKNPKAVDPLLEKLKQIENVEHERVDQLKAEIVKTLGKIADPKTFDLIKNSCNSSIQEIRHAAIKSIGYFKNHESMSLLMGLLVNSKNKHEKEIIKDSVLLCADYDNAQILIDYLNNDDEFINDVLCTSILKIQDQRVVDLLISKITSNHSDSLYLKKLIELLAEIGSQKATVPLILLLDEHKELFLKEAVINALGKLQDPQAVDSLIDLLELSLDFKLNTSIIKALANIGDKNAAPKLIPLIYENQDKWKLLKYIIEALGYLPDAQTLPHLNQILANCDASLKGWVIRTEATEAITKIKNYIYNTSDKQVSDKEPIEFW